MALLELTDVEARYGPVRALHGVSLAVDEGQIVAVLGANGAGKTTTLRAISGTVRGAARSSFDGTRARPPRPGGGREARRRARPRGPRHVRASSPSRRTCASAPTRAAARSTADIERMSGYFPWIGGAARPARRHALRRRAADARARPGADGPPAAAAARRAVARARAARHARDLPHRARAERAGGPDRARRRAERRDRARGRRRAPTCSRSARSPCPGRATSSPATSPSARATWATERRWPSSSSRSSRGSRSGAIYARLALALVLIHRATGVINFAQGEMAMFTTYIAWTLIANHGWSYWPAFVATLVFAFVARRRRSSGS